MQSAPDIIVSGNSRIVSAVVNDPVEQGFILSMAHPEGNVSGFSFIDVPLSPYRDQSRAKVACHLPAASTGPHWLAGVGGFELSHPEKPPLEHC